MVWSPVYKVEISILLVFDEYTLVKYLESPHRIAVRADVNV